MEESSCSKRDTQAGKPCRGHIHVGDVVSAAFLFVYGNFGRANEGGGGDRDGRVTRSISCGVFLLSTT